MIDYYRVPVKKGVVTKEQKLHIGDDSELKDALYNKSIEKVKYLSFKNSNIKDQTLRLLEQITTPLPIIHVDLSQNFSFVTDQAIEILVSLPCMRNLKGLNLSDNQITDDSMVTLAKASSMHNLQQLILYGNTDITGAGILLISQSPFLKSLKHLDLHATSVDDEGMEQLMRSQVSQSLQKLNLSMSWKLITNKTLYFIANSKHCRKLKELFLQDCRISDQGLDQLSQSQNSSSLIHLNLNNSIKQQNNVISDKSLTSIALSKFMANIKHLELRNTDITAKGIKTLSVSSAAESLQTLRLSHCKKINEEVLVYLQKISSYQTLKKVYLNQCKIDRGDLKSFELRNNKLNLIF